MTEIQQNRYDRLVRRVANIVGGGSQVNDTLNELFPVIEVERVPGELLALMGTRIAWGRGDRTGDAGERAQLQLFNPDGSGTLISVSSMYLVSTAINTISWAIGTAPFTTLTTAGGLRDTRLRIPTTNRAVGEMRTQSSAVPVGGENEIRVLANVPFKISDENTIAVLTPGHGLNVEVTANATRLIASFNWRERVAEPAELNL